MQNIAEKMMIVVVGWSWLAMILTAVLLEYNPGRRIAFWRAYGFVVIAPLLIVGTALLSPIFGLMIVVDMWSRFPDDKNRSKTLSEAAEKYFREDHE